LQPAAIERVMGIGSKLSLWIIGPLAGNST